MFEREARRKLERSRFERHARGNFPETGTGSSTDATDRVLLLPEVESPRLSRVSSSDLIAAAEAGDAERVMWMLQQPHVDVNERGFGRLAALHVAAERNNFEVVEVLLKHPRVDVNVKDVLGRTPLLMAAREGAIMVVWRILRWGHRLDAEIPATGGITCLHVAAYCGHFEIVKFLLDSGTTLARKLLLARTSEEKFTALHVAACKGHEGVVRALLDACKFLKGAIDWNSVTNAEDCIGRTPLHYAASENHTGVVKVLLSVESVDVNFQDLDGYTPMHLAMQRNHQEVVALLIAKDEIQITIKARNNRATRDYLSTQKLQECVTWEELPRPKVSDFIFTEDRDSLSALDYAVERSMLYCTSLLVTALTTSRRGGTVAADILEGIESQLQRRPFQIKKTTSRYSIGLDDPKITLMHVAACEGRRDLLEALAATPGESSSVDINATDSHNHTPLHWATMEGKIDIVRFLLAQPTIRVNEEDIRNRTALQIAFDGGKKAIEKLLLERQDVKAYLDRLYRDRQVSVDATNAILVGAALIASVTYSGWLQPPLGYTTYYQFPFRGSAPPDTYESFAAVEQYLSVRVFWIFNSLSFYYAIATILTGAGAVLPRTKLFIREQVKIARRWLVLLTGLMVVSAVSVLGSFTAAGFAALPQQFKYDKLMLGTSVVGLLPCIQALGFFLVLILIMMRDWGFLHTRSMVVTMMRSMHVFTAVGLSSVVVNLKWFIPEYTVFWRDYSWDRLQIWWPYEPITEVKVEQPSSTGWTFGNLGRKVTRTAFLNMFRQETGYVHQILLHTSFFIYKCVTWWVWRRKS